MDYLFLLSRILYGGFFIMGGINHFTHLDMMAGYAGFKGVPAPKPAVIASGVLILLGGIGIVLGVFVAWSVLFIVAFLAPVTVMMHTFWSDTDPQMKLNNMVNFQKNVALLGAALALLFVPQPWPLSL